MSPWMAPKTMISAPPGGGGRIRSGPGSRDGSEYDEIPLHERRGKEINLLIELCRGCGSCGLHVFKKEEFDVRCAWGSRH